MHFLHEKLTASVGVHHILLMCFLILAAKLHAAQGLPNHAAALASKASKNTAEDFTPKENNWQLNHLRHKRTAVQRVAQKVEEVTLTRSRRENADVVNANDHSVHIRETPETSSNTERLDRLEKSIFYVGKKLQDLEHKILVRQIGQTGNPGQSDFGTDDLVASLIRQRDDFIAAAAVPESPLPVQNVRLSLNSGL